jgi:hypothetical protein
MQWRAATLGRNDTTQFRTCCTDPARQERDVAQIQVGYISRTSQVRQGTGSDSLVPAGPRVALPVGFDLPCRQDPGQSCHLSGTSARARSRTNNLRASIRAVGASL